MKIEIRRFGVESGRTLAKAKAEEPVLLVLDDYVNIAIRDLGEQEFPPALDDVPHKELAESVDLYSNGILCVYLPTYLMVHLYQLGETVE